jgi:hypothetical protein
MRGYDRPQSTMLTLVNPEQRVPANHPIRLIKELAEVALKELSPLFESFGAGMHPRELWGYFAFADYIRAFWP